MRTHPFCSMTAAWCLVALCGIGLAAMSSVTAFAGQADVVAVKVRQTAAGVYSFDVTVRHADNGWSHYANKWEIVAPDGTVLGTRVLHHPHDNEQPFTRSLEGVKISPAIPVVTVRAFDSRHGPGGKTARVTLPAR